MSWTTTGSNGPPNSLLETAAPEALEVTEMERFCGDVGKGG